MYQTAYDTIAGKMALDSDVVSKLTDYITLTGDNPESQLAKTKRGKNSQDVYRLLSGSAEIPAFSQPIYIDNPNGTNCFVADIRPFIIMTNAKNQEYKVNNYLAYDSVLDRLVMEVMWIEHGPERILGLGLFPMKIFTRWLTNVVAKRLAIPQETQYSMMILSAYYFYCLHVNSTDRDFNQIDLSRVVGLIHRVTGLELRNIHDLVTGLPILRDLNGFIQVLKDRTGSTRLATLTPAGLFALVGNTIGGHDPRVTIGVALEHPPTFVALTYTSLTYRGAGKSGLAEVIKPLANSQEARDFTGSYKGLVAQFSQ